MTDSSAPEEQALASALGAVAARLEPASEAARLCSEAATRLADNLGKNNAFYPALLAEVMGAVAARLGPAEAAALARRLADALGEEDAAWRPALAKTLAAVVALLGPAEAAKLCAEAARRLADDLSKTTDYVHWRPLLARALGAEVHRMEPAEAARLLADALAQETNADARFELAQALGAVTIRIDPGEAAPRSLLATRAVVAWLSPSPQLGQAATLLQAVEPLPNRFTTQQLVDLLKMPTCVGPARTVILELLGNRYHRTFADQWEFAEFAEKHLPDIDLKSPPKRPQK